VPDKHPDDPKLRGLQIGEQERERPGPGPPFTELVYWFAERSNTLCRLTMTMGQGAEMQRSDMTVDFDPKVPAGWFDVKLPPDCTDVAAGVRARLSPDVREVYDQVAAARKRFGDYRAVIWRNATGGWPMFREAVRGEQWRCDEIDWVVQHGAFGGQNSQGYVKIGPDDPFAKLWQQVNRRDLRVERDRMTFQGKLAILYYNARRPRGPDTSAQLLTGFQMGYEKKFARRRPPDRLAGVDVVGKPCSPTGGDLRNRRCNGGSPARPPARRLGPGLGEASSGSWRKIAMSSTAARTGSVSARRWTDSSGPPKWKLGNPRFRANGRRFVVSAQRRRWQQSI